MVEKQESKPGESSVLESNSLGSDPSSATDELCDPGQVTKPLCAMVSSSVKWG